MSKHDLENMIFNLEERKDLKKVEFTQKAVIEILGYLKQLADLEAKLAESEKESNARYEILQEEIRECDRLRVVLAEVRKQLAEKEEEIEGLKEQRSICLKRSVDEVNQITELELKLQYEQRNKISFALEQLEKVKEHISSGLAFDIDVQMWFEEYIENQIKQLKEGK